MPRYPSIDWWRSEFQVNIAGRKKKKKIELLFRFKDTFVWLDLSYKEWINLLKFLKTTQTRKNLPKGTNGYREYVIDRNKIWYDNMNEASFVYAPKSAYTKEEKQRFAIRVKRTLRNIRKTLLSDEICLRKGEVFVYLMRAKFIRFRSFCLNPKHYLRY